MCGILGLAGAACPAEVARALALLAHRGPDGEGVWSDDRVTLGHRRLALIDVHGGGQPFISTDGNHVLVFNGEIYNFTELGKVLRGCGHVLTTHSDTEVLLHWLMAFGTKRLADLNGMFAFAYWNRSARRLILARDRLGIKPLYLARPAGVLAFASEIKALLPWLSRIEVDGEAVYQHLTFQNILDQTTFFRGVEKLEPGTWLSWTPESETRGCFFDLSFTANWSHGSGAAVEHFAATLKTIVKRQMISDFPVGAYLSGGIDSAAVATTAATGTEHDFHTFTGAFVDAPYYDERPGSRAVARQIGAISHEIEIDSTDFVSVLEKVIWHLDEPTLGSGAVPQYMVSGLAAKTVKAVLTGHGGDELFAGYQVNKATLLKQTAATAPWRLPSILANIRPDEMTRVAYFLLSTLVVPEVGHGLFIMTPERRRQKTLSGDFLATHRRYEPLETIAKLLSGRGLDRGAALTFLYLRCYLQTLLIQEDKLGMAHSLEARFPLCDNDFLDFSLKLPFAAKMFDGRLKAIPKAAMRNVLPPILYTLPKRGFPTPIVRWFRKEPVRGMIADLLLSRRSRERGILSPAAVQDAFNTLSAGRFDTLIDYARANRLYSYATIELWHRLFIDQSHDRLRRHGLDVGCFASSLGSEH